VTAEQWQQFKAAAAIRAAQRRAEAIAEAYGSGGAIPEEEHRARLDP
jgi:hypothetical protein